MCSKRIAIATFALLIMTLHSVAARGQHWNAVARTTVLPTAHSERQARFGIQVRTPKAGRAEAASAKDLALGAAPMRSHVGIINTSVRRFAAPGSLEDSRAQQQNQIPSNRFHDSSDLQEIHFSFLSNVRAARSAGRAQLLF